LEDAMDGVIVGGDADSWEAGWGPSTHLKAPICPLSELSYLGGTYRTSHDKLNSAPCFPQHPGFNTSDRDCHFVSHGL
jgi:hypothetical protein